MPVARLDGIRVGYVMGVGDEVPAGMEALGATVELLDEAALAALARQSSPDGSAAPAGAGPGAEIRFDAIVVGTRAYAVRADLLEHNRGLLEHLHGGHLVRDRRPPRHRRARAQTGRVRQLAVVVRGGGHPHAHLLLRTPVAAGGLTDAEVIEIRYGGAPARVLRCFSAVYQGLLKNAVVMGWVMLAMVKFSQVLLGWDPAVTLAVCVGLALAYTVASGLWGVVVTDLLQFVTGMLGATTLAGIVLTRFGGLSAMADAVREAPGAPPGALDLVPTSTNASSLEIVSFLCLILILWLRSGQGDGYVAQRLFATRDERQAVKASLWFAFAGTVLLTWPWIVVGLGSLLVFPPRPWTRRWPPTPSSPIR